ncbi:MAG TPA: amidohydrolase family protein [Acidimicrobiales bacterium]|nr:amidohydrolase family protein [Acidimicrobiales bacterium]
MTTLEAMSQMDVWQAGSQEYDRSTAVLPDPEPRERRHLIISVDDHLVEPPDLFTKRLPKKYLDRAPRVVEEGGREYWLIDGGLELNVGGNAAAGRSVDAPLGGESVRFDEMRRGAWDIHERIRDMDINGIYASLGFPSMVFSFAGQRFMRMRDPGLGQLCVRAYNDWVIDEWTAPYPERIIPSQVVWLLDAEIAAAEVHRNAERGFKAVNFTENPQKLGLPSIHTDYWDPLFAACEETQTVLNLHVGSSSQVTHPSTDAPVDTIAALFMVNSMVASVDWVYSGIAVRFPELKIALSEGGIGWVPAVLDRLEYLFEFPRTATWSDQSISPADILRRNFWFASFWDPSAFEHRHQIGIDHIMVEADYPHVDSTWPDTQAMIDRELEGLPAEDVRKITCENAAQLYRHPLPAA